MNYKHGIQYFLVNKIDIIGVTETFIVLNISIYTACSKVSVAIPIAVENAREEVGQCETRRWR